MGKHLQKFLGKSSIAIFSIFTLMMLGVAAYKLSQATPVIGNEVAIQSESENQDSIGSRIKSALSFDSDEDEDDDSPVRSQTVSDDDLNSDSNDDDDDDSDYSNGQGTTNNTENNSQVSQNNNNQNNSNNTGSSSCLISLFGQTYNVTSLRSSHSGGNVFVCGSDMTATYTAQHGTNVSRMQAYLVTNTSINANNNQNTNNTQNTQNNTSNQQNNNTSTNTASNRCIITLSGQQYDVTSLRSSHPGGNVFVCGADQTALYQSAHGSNLSRMQGYLVTNTGTSITQPGSSQPQYDTERRREHEDEDEDEDD